MVRITKQEHLSQYGLDVFLIKSDNNVKNLSYSEQLKLFEKILKENDKINFKKYSIDINTQDFVNDLFTINVWDIEKW